MNKKRLSVLLSVCFYACLSLTAEASSVHIVTENPVIVKVADFLQNEIHSRGLDWNVSMGLESDFQDSQLQALPEISEDGFKILVSDDLKDVIIAGNNSRGVIYGVGKLLRMDTPKSMSQTPVNRYRVQNFNGNPRFQSQTDPACLKLFNEYFRDVALFGANGIEILRNTPNEIIDIIKSWGLEVWIVTYDNASPATFRNPQGLKNELDFRCSLINNLSWIDHYNIKSGDPGDLPIDDFFNFTEMEATVVRNKFPEAKIWITPQHFKDAPQEYFEKACQHMNDSPWVDGAIAGCWTRFTAREMRERLRPDISLIQGPDITHIYSNMYPARDMDLALARSLGRICIDVSPATQKHIHNLADRWCDGSQCYSEGTTDDLHKCLWSALDYDPSIDVHEFLCEYSRLFFPELDENVFADAVLAVEQNAIGPLEKSTGMPETLKLWESLETSASESTLENPRFLMLELRACFDTYIYKRWMRDLPLEQECYELMVSSEDKTGKICSRIRTILQQSDICVDSFLKNKCQSLYQKVYKDKRKWMIQNQPNFLMEQMDIPLTDQLYICYALDGISTIPNQKEAREELRKLGTRFRSTPERIYFNLGDFSTEHITLIDSLWAEDPAYLKHPVRMFGCHAKKFIISGNTMRDGTPAPRAWLVQAGQYYDSPMCLTFPGLKPGALYKVQITYAGEVARSPVNIKLTQDGKIVHRPLRVASEVEGEWTLPLPCDEEGKISLEWKCNYGERGVAVAEIAFVEISTD